MSVACHFGRVEKWLEVIFVEMCSRIKCGITYNKNRDCDPDGVTGRNLNTRKLNQKRIFTSKSSKFWRIKKLEEIAVAPVVSRTSKKRRIDVIGDIDENKMMLP